MEENNCNDDLLVYYSELVNFAVEYRLLIGNNKLYGQGFQKGNKLINLDLNFINDLIKLSHQEFFCIDIGYIIDKKEWAVVEINPPFALDDYGIKLNDYMDYFFDFWNLKIKIG
jgi:hypothetical protein